MPRIKNLLAPEPLLELFLLMNVAGVGLDILVAHKVNNFENPWEWAPILVLGRGDGSLCVGADALGIVSGTVRGPTRHFRAAGRALGVLIGLGSVVVGVAGLIFHLQSRFFQEQTIHSLVYTAPFVAPLAYTVIGLLIILNRLQRSDTVDWGRWVVLLTMGGFLGNFALSLCDHAQNGFFQPTEWTGVIAGAAAVGVLTAVLLIPDNRPLIRLALVVMALQVLVGLAGFGLHVEANLRGVMKTVWENFVYGAPAFAPMLFADAATLATLGLWCLTEPPRMRPASACRRARSCRGDSAVFVV